MELDPKQLNAFASAADSGSLAGAARSLNITLAAISIRIKTLEAQLGQRLLVRGKQARPTPAGQLLLAHVRRARLLEAELDESLLGAGHARSTQSPRWQPLHVAVNADSLGSWFLSGVQDTLTRNHLLLRCTVDDQDYTLQALKSGDVIGCVTTLPQALRGCVAEPLGVMRYHCLAAPSLAERLRKPRNKATRPTSPTLAALCSVPALCFNEKDNLQERFIRETHQIENANYPRHHIPDNDGYHQAMLQGLGWGLQADVQLRLQWPGDLEQGRLIDLYPGHTVDVPLYWHHWQQEGSAAQRLTKAVIQAARAALQ